MENKNLAILAIVIFIFGFVLSGISLAKIDASISVNVPSKITVGEDFVVRITLTNNDNSDIQANDDIDIKIYVDDVLVHEENNYNLGFDLTPDNETEINISSTQFRVDGNDIWSRNLMDYDCNVDKEVRVEISGDVSDDYDSDKMDIEPYKDYYELTFTISPTSPTVNQKVTIRAEDEDGNDLRDGRVKLTRLGDNDEWDYDDKYKERGVDSNGEFDIILNSESRFESDPYSKYQVDVWVKDKYCKVTKYFDTRRTLNITEIPTTGFVGKAVKVRVIDDTGNPVPNANVALSKVGFHTSFKTDSGGYASLVLDETGEYSMVASKTGYVESGISNLDIKLLGGIGIAIQPSDALVGKSVKIVITGSDGTLLPNAKIIITKPDGTQEVKTTPDTGQITYTPSLVGTYKVKAEEASHTPSEDSFKVANEFTITLPDKIELNKDITVIVKNQNGILIEGATVTVSGTSVAGITDKDGKFTFKLHSPGDFTVSIKKADFKDGSATISIKGQLALAVTPVAVDVDGKVNFKVTDSFGNEIKDANIEITKPDGSKEAATNNEYVTKVTGNHSATASKANYESASANFAVNKLPLELEATFERGNTLKVTVTSNGVPLMDIPVTIDTIFGGEELITDELGTVEIKLVNITEKMNVTIRVDDPKYEKREISKEITPGGGIFSVWLLLIVLIILLIVAVYLRIKKSGGKGLGIGGGIITTDGGSKKKGISLVGSGGGKKRKGGLGGL